MFDAASRRGGGTATPAGTARSMRKQRRPPRYQPTATGAHADPRSPAGVPALDAGHSKLIAEKLDRKGSAVPLRLLPIGNAGSVLMTLPFVLLALIVAGHTILDQRRARRAAKW